MPRLVEIAPMVWEKDFLKLLISPFGKGRSPNPRHPSVHCAEFGCNWSSGSGGFLNFVNDFSLFRYHLPWENNVAYPLNKLKPPSPNGALSQV